VPSEKKQSEDFSELVVVSTSRNTISFDGQIYPASISDEKFEGHIEWDGAGFSGRDGVVIDRISGTFSHTRGMVPKNNTNTTIIYEKVGKCTTSFQKQF